MSPTTAEIKLSGSGITAEILAGVIQVTRKIERGAALAFANYILTESWNACPLCCGWREEKAWAWNNSWEYWDSFKPVGDYIDGLTGQVVTFGNLEGCTACIIATQSELATWARPVDTLGIPPGLHPMQAQFWTLTPAEREDHRQRNRAAGYRV